MSEPWRKHLAALGKDASARPASKPLFAPVIFSAAAQIEAVDARDMLEDATLLGKCLNGTRQLLNLDCLYVCAPSEAEAEAAKSDNPAAQPRLAAGIEVCQRLSDTEGDRLALLAGLTGPAALATRLMAGQDVDDIEDYYEQASAGLLALVKALGEAGCSGIWFQENAAPGDADDEREIWEDSLTPIVNVARFHKLPVFVSFTEHEPDECPAGVIVCASGGGDSAAGLLPADWNTWNELPGDCQIVLTPAEVDPAAKLADLREQIGRMAG